LITSDNANKRISALFIDLLERQFPIDENHQKIYLRSASDFATQLNIHVNHLNRAVKRFIKENNHSNCCRTHSSGGKDPVNAQCLEHI